MRGLLVALVVLVMGVGIVGAQVSQQWEYLIVTVGDSVTVQSADSEYDAELASEFDKAGSVLAYLNRLGLDGWVLTAAMAQNSADAYFFRRPLGSVSVVGATADSPAGDALAFTGTSNRALGPIDLPSGTYRVTVTTAGFITADVETLAGDCYIVGAGSLLFALSSGDASNGAEAIIRSQNCSMLIAVEARGGAEWTLTFEQV